MRKLLKVYFNKFWIFNHSTYGHNANLLLLDDPSCTLTSYPLHQQTQIGNHL